MSHLDVDQFAARSPLIAFDPRVKLLCALALIVIMAFLTRLEPLIVVCVFVLALAIGSLVPVKHLLRNYLLTLVFIAFASFTAFLVAGYLQAVIMFLRVSASVLVLLVLVTTTPFFMMMDAFRSLRMPRTLSSLIMFTYRYIFVLVEEMQTMSMARKARGFSGGRHLLDAGAFGTLSATIGMVFVRAQVRATNIYDALLSRGFTGELRGSRRLKVRPRDGLLATAFVAVSALSIAIQTGVLRWTLSF